MKIILLSLLSIFLILNQGKTSSSSQVLIEIQKSSSGMVSSPGKFLYLRVTSDGQSQFDAIGNMSGGVRLNRKLTNDQTQRLRTLVARQESKELAERYDGAPAIDYVEAITLVIPRGDQQQTIRVINFCPRCENVKYPTSLVDLLCEIKGIRTNGDTRLAKLDPAWCAL